MQFEDDIKKALETLRTGGIILYPTDTIWGLGCDPTNREAVKKIFGIKSRSASKSLIILVNNDDMLARYVKEIPDTARQLYSVSDSPLTIIYPQGKNLAEGVCNEDGSVGIRICNDDFCQELITRFRKPLVSTSANLTGLQAPQIFEEIDEEIIRSVAYVVKHRQDDWQKHSASPVIKIDKNGVISILRK